MYSNIAFTASSVNIERTPSMHLTPHLRFSHIFPTALYDNMPFADMPTVAVIARRLANSRMQVAPLERAWGAPETHQCHVSASQAMTARVSPFVTAAPCFATNVILPEAVALIGLKSFIASTMQTASPALTTSPSFAISGLPGPALR